jgi:methylmalonyl-CoA mutase cobalamin-binding subunit
VDAGGEIVVEGAFATPEEAAALQAWTTIPVPVMGWRVVDQFARILGGDPLADGPLPSQLLTVANAADAVVDENGNYIGIADYQDQFTALWGVK